MAPNVQCPLGIVRASHRHSSDRTESKGKIKNILSKMYSIFFYIWLSLTVSHTLGNCSQKIVRATASNSGSGHLNRYRKNIGSECTLSGIRRLLYLSGIRRRYPILMKILPPQTKNPELLHLGVTRRLRFLFLFSRFLEEGARSDRSLSLIPEHLETTTISDSYL